MEHSTRWHSVESLRGIGPATADRMRELGYVYAEHLLARPPLVVVGDLSPIDQVTAQEVVNQYLPQARLMRLPDIPAELAGRLVARGIDLSAFVVFDDASLSDHIARAGGEVTAVQVLRWKEAAARIGLCGGLLVSLRDPEGSVLPGARLHVTNPLGASFRYVVTVTSNDRGEALLEGVAPGWHTLHADGAGGLTAHVSVVAPLSGYRAVSLTLDASPAPPPTGPAIRSRTVTAATEFDKDETLFVSAAGDDYRLTTARPRPAGAYSELISIRVPTDSFDVALEVGRLVRPQGDGFAPVDGTLEDLRTLTPHP